MKSVQMFPILIMYNYYYEYAYKIRMVMYRRDLEIKKFLAFEQISCVVFIKQYLFIYYLILSILLKLRKIIFYKICIKCIHLVTANRTDIRRDIH